MELFPKSNASLPVLLETFISDMPIFNVAVKDLAGEIQNVRTNVAESIRDGEGLAAGELAKLAVPC